MALKNYFFYDERNCDFVPVKYNTFERVVYTACSYILFGVVFAGLGISILSTTVGTPAEIALKAENQALLHHLEETKTTIKDLDSELNQLAQTDNEMYRSVLGMEPIPYDEREAGMGGADVYSDYDVYSQETAEILKWTSEKLEMLERGINIQKASFTEIKKYYNGNQEKMEHIPAIKPVQGILLSGYGMRFHPVLKYRRMHEGLDFRANVGDDVYATGDGTIKYASRKGTYGRLVIVDHGYGYETRYAHLSSFADGIKPGAKISRGDLVGYSGHSGMVEGPHLHYEVYRDGKPIDPINYLFADITPDEFLMYQEIAENNQKSMD
ncbi:M23 family metallopeptidase [Aliifodinibius sp. S!AR15-10]|uniref:M23 family metallopeptidase n=1 Tax=Aliifodinibius sp. S!AR15-10 TaxID=2950437 RepID=UPI00285C248C|nr:M23 family metallopeptidase [Aliifodinibius sp. S!AR15-10]MDR8391816.1 M23 family metallopeptidase [Aliifodinibius sp. S!AR15-10]